MRRKLKSKEIRIKFTGSKEAIKKAETEGGSKNALCGTISKEDTDKVFEIFKQQEMLRKAKK